MWDGRKKLDLAQAVERGSLPVVRAWASHFHFVMKILARALWVLRAPAEGSV